MQTLRPAPTKANIIRIRPASRPKVPKNSVRAGPPIGWRRLGQCSGLNELRLSQKLPVCQPLKKRIPQTNGPFETLARPNGKVGANAAAWIVCVKAEKCGVLS